VPLGLLAYTSIHLSSNALRHEVAQRVDSTSAIGASLVESEMTGLTDLVQAYASRPYLLRAVEMSDGGRRDALIASQLHQLRQARPGIATTFLAQPDGRLIAIDPPTPSIVGKDFSFRDWYRGVTRTGRPYVSRAYISQASGRPRVVAATVPVRDGTHGAEKAILVAAYDLGHVQQVVHTLARAEGVRLRITDQYGVLVAAPTARGGLVSRRRDPQVVAALAGRSGLRTAHGPHGDSLVSFRPIPSLGWTISSSVPSRIALARIGGLRTTVAWIAGALALLLLLGAAALSRSISRRHRAEAGLARQATINRAVLDGVRDAISMNDIKGRRLFANARMRELEAELLGAPPGIATDFEIAARLTEPDRYLDHRRLEQNDPDAELVGEFELADSRRHILRYSAPVNDEQGSRLGRIVVVRDTTAERKAEQIKTDLVATVSHELRTPLTGILGFAELLQQPELDPATRERYATTIHAEASRLTELINDFLDLQRIEAGALTLSLETVDLRDLIREVVEVFRGGDEDHPIDVELPDHPLDVAADAARLAQLLANLLSNAVKYSPDGGPTTVRAEAGDGVVRVSVRDSGIGISPDQQRQLFTKFYRVDSSDTRSIGGTGLGLALAREIAEAHGGRIGVDSAIGKGSTFWFELAAGQRRTERRPHVLVVEDDPAAAEILLNWLADDFDVGVADNGTVALDHAHRRVPEVVCLDIDLPGELSGWQVLTHLKDDSLTAHVPVIVCTGSNGRRRAAALGAADFLTKPFSGEVLRAAVARLIPADRADVLVVDDDARIRSLVVATLEAEGHTLSEAADGIQALAAIDEHHPDAIVLDLLMPGMDGFEVLEHLQADPRSRAIPVLVLTARDLSPGDRRILGARAVSVLEKSEYSAAELRRLVSQALGWRHHLVS
jgi:signal transduction histidine kinase/DNA-binding response OmpR family regulator